MTATLDRRHQPPRAPAGNRLRLASSRLAQRVAAALSESPRRVGPMLRIEVRADGVEPLEWLAAQPASPRLYWSDRDEKFSVAGVGTADMLSLDAGLVPADLMARVAGRLEGAPSGIRYFGGFRFDTRAPVSPTWRSFGLGCLVLPRLECVEDGDATTLACNVFPGRDSVHQVVGEIERLVSAPAPLEPPGPPRWREDLPLRDDWLSLVDRVCREAEGGDGGPAKLVLARRSTFTFDAELDPLALLRATRLADERCFLFCFDPGGGATFVGATPERLFHRRGRQVTSEALAGTRPRGATPAEDARLRADLLQSGKEEREHASVVRHIRAGLEGLTDTLHGDHEPSVVALAHVQHLNLRMTGRLKPGVTDAALLDALHPTPAVAGEPPLPALDRISDLEPFDRGWYAGPVGYAGADDTQFAVAIRSGLVHGHRADLYAGAGILAGSSPEEEWRELESKMRRLHAVWTHG